MDAITLEPSSTALLVVDVQERLAAAMPDFDRRRTIASIELLLETARLLRMPVLATEQYPRGLGPTVEPIKVFFQQFDPPVAVVEKTVFSALGSPDIARTLSNLKVRSVITVGMEAHVCVFQTARELKARGYYPHVPFDAVASRNPECRQMALASLRHHGVTVTTTETVVFDLLRDASHPHFKALSQRVKNLPLPR